MSTGAWVRTLPKSTYYETSKIKSNLRIEDLQLCLNILQYFVNGGHVFANFVGQRFDIEEMSIHEKGPGKEGRAVVEITVEKDMTNPYGTLHGACAAYLVDLCTSVPLVALGIATGIDGSGMSQSMDIIYHSAAPVGCRLRIEATTLTIGGRIMAARCEMLNKKNGKLLISATHTKINPYGSSNPKIKKAGDKDKEEQKEKEKAKL
ncbi:hypothetical protein OE88DRAFT_841592 [Heliocybe sulcata]|uniref:Thioesterase domain-containing protein n=1 Tax=Heliocybe sulcata TaxID=5364 RepID=A0A5C3MNB6_9AGAM|nr:hypothetical protein OE88DRAFT_841592 [Heliocybe sulcata]